MLPPGGRRHRAAGRARPERDARRAAGRRRHPARAGDRGRDRGARRSSRRRSTCARRRPPSRRVDRDVAGGVAHARRRRGADVRARGDPGRAGRPVAGAALAWGRALGEFGATLMFAGSFRGRHPDRAAGDLRPLRDRLPRRARALGRARRACPSRCCWRSSSSPAAGRSAVLRVEARTRARGARRSTCAASRPAECLALAGPSGAGKSRVLRVVAGLLRRARAAWPAARPSGWTPARASTCRRSGAAAATCSRTTRCSGTCSAWQNVAYGLRGAPRASGAGGRMALLDRFGLAEHADARPRTLSGGERQRVALARALARARPCCCSTSRCRRSTRARARARGASSRARAAQAPACRRSSSPTTSTRRRCWATASA